MIDAINNNINARFSRPQNWIYKVGIKDSYNYLFGGTPIYKRDRPFFYGIPVTPLGTGDYSIFYLCNEIGDYCDYAPIAQIPRDAILFLIPIKSAVTNSSVTEMQEAEKKAFIEDCIEGRL